MNVRLGFSERQGRPRSGNGGMPQGLGRMRYVGDRWLLYHARQICNISAGATAGPVEEPRRGRTVLNTSSMRREL
jgi:hypothetical protein